MGLANIEFKRGATPTSISSIGLRETSEGQASKNDSVDLEESIFAFSKAPEDQIGHVTKGGSTGAKVRLEPAQSGNKERVIISLNGKEAGIDVAENLGRNVEIHRTLFTLQNDNYWPE